MCKREGTKRVSPGGKRAESPTMNRRQRKRWERYLREIEAAEAKAMSPEAVARPGLSARRNARRSGWRYGLQRIAGKKSGRTKGTF